MSLLLCELDINAIIRAHCEGKFVIGHLLLYCCSLNEAASKEGYSGKPTASLQVKVKQRHLFLSFTLTIFNYPDNETLRWAQFLTD